jgi:O-acetyl-ADP-ribose deacetylase (regulator of RNase III)
MESTITISDIPTLSLLYDRGQLQHPSGSHIRLPNQILNDKVAHINADITKLHIDAIVNAANPTLLGGGGVDGAIHRAAGHNLLAACQRLGGCKTGSAKVTDGYNLPAKKVIHAVGPRYWLAGNAAATLLRGCYRRSLELAAEHECASLAFPAVSTGIYGYPHREAAEIAIGEVREFLVGPNGHKIQKVVFCSFHERDMEAYEEWLP